MIKNPKSIVLFFFLLPFGISAQNKEQEKSTGKFERVEIVDHQTVYNRAQQMPEFPGEKGALIKYLIDNTKYPEEAKKNNVHGMVLVRFVVDTAGKIKHAKVLKGIGAGCDEEALRVVNSMPRWTPGKDSGQLVNVFFNLPIRFELEVESDSLLIKSGMENMKKGNLEDAIVSFTKALKFNPKNSDALFYRGTAYFRMKDNDKACDDWGRASEMGNENAVKTSKKYCQR